MPSTPVTIVGNLVADPTRREKIDATTFRVAVQHSRLNRETGEFIDDGASFYNVTAWGRLGINAATSLRRGQRVIVSGTLKLREYTTDAGEMRTSADISAAAVGPDLTWGYAMFMKVDHSEPRESPDQQDSQQPEDASTQDRDLAEELLMSAE